MTCCPGGGLSCAGDWPWAAGCWMVLLSGWLHCGFGCVGGVLSGWLAVWGWLCGWLVVWMACCPGGWLCGWPASRVAGLKDGGDKC
jgi:hypothetical protein